jgi:hypothetical protein
MAALAAAPVLGQAQGFGVQIRSLLPYTAPGGTAASIYARTGDCVGPVACADAFSFETGFLSGVASAFKTGGVASSGSVAGQFSQSTVSGSALASMGALGATANAHVSSTNTAVAGFFVDTALAGFQIDARDDIFLQSAQLPAGSMVNVRFTLTLDSSVLETGSLPTRSGNVGASLFFDTEGGSSPSLSINDGTQGGPPALRTVSTILLLQVGQTYSMVQRLGLSVAGTVQSTLVPGFAPVDWTLNISADHTSHAYIDVLGNATLVAGSGHNYASPVPEPAGALLLLAGLGLVGAAVRRRQAG